MHRCRHNWRGILVFEAIIAIITTIIVVVWIAFIQSEFVATLLALGLTAFAIFLIVRRNEWVSGPVIFPVLLGVFHLGIVVPVFLFGFPPPPASRWLESEWLLTALALYTLAIGTFAAGSLLGASRFVGVTPVYRPLPDKTIAMMWSMLFVVCCAGYIFFGLLTDVWSELNRFRLWELRESGLPLFGLFRAWIVISAFGTIAFSRRNIGVVTACLMIVVFLPTFIIGQRGFFIVNVAAVVVVLRLRGVHIPGPVLLIGALCLFLLIPVIREMRGGAPSFVLGLLDPFYEMGAQLRVVVFTIDAVAGGDWGYEWGGTYWDAIGQAIPNMFGSQRPQSPSVIITTLYNYGGAGLGMTEVAEAYVNYGIMGVFFVFLGLGWGITKAEHYATRSPFALTFYGALAGSLFWLVRADSHSVTRTVAWSGVAVLLSYMYSKRHMRNVQIYQ